MNNKSILDDVKKSASNLNYAIKLQDHAALIGFDWPNIQAVFEKLTEEIGELKAEIGVHENMQKIEEEFGDLLFVCTNLARHLKIDPEIALEKANHKFKKRFQAMEQQLKLLYADASVSLAVMDEIWEKVKADEKNKINNF